MMHLITYISDYTGTLETLQQDLQDITAVAKSENARRHITGVLFFMHDKFLQVIEGDEKDLRQLMTNIEGDSRHENVEILIDTKIEKRGFYDWNMDTFDFSNGKKFNNENLRELTKSFEENLLPRSDMLVMFYKKLLQKADV